MSDDLNWKELFKRYMKAVLNDESWTARECADPSDFDGTADERAAVWALYLEVYREERPNDPAIPQPRTPRRDD